MWIHGKLERVRSFGTKRSFIDRALRIALDINDLATLHINKLAATHGAIGADAVYLGRVVNARALGNGVRTEWLIARIALFGDSVFLRRTHCVLHNSFAIPNRRRVLHPLRQWTAIASPMNKSTSLRNPQHRVCSREAAIELQPRAKPWEIDDTSSSPAGTIESRSAVPPERQSPSTSVHSVLDRG